MGVRTIQRISGSVFHYPGTYWEASGKVSELNYKRCLFDSSRQSYCIEQSVRSARLKTTSNGGGDVPVGYDGMESISEEGAPAPVESTTVRWSHGPVSYFGKKN